MVEVMILGGLTELDIAHSIGCSQPTVNRIKRGAEPGYVLGRRIEALYLLTIDEPLLPENEYEED